MEQAPSKDHEASSQSGQGVGCKLFSSSKELRGLSVRAQARRIGMPLSFTAVGVSSTGCGSLSANGRLFPVYEDGALSFFVCHSASTSYPVPFSSVSAPLLFVVQIPEPIQVGRPPHTYAFYHTITADPGATARAGTWPSKVDNRLSTRPRRGSPCLCLHRAPCQPQRQCRR